MGVASAYLLDLWNISVFIFHLRIVFGKYIRQVYERIVSFAMVLRAEDNLCPLLDLA